LHQVGNQLRLYYTKFLPIVITKSKRSPGLSEEQFVASQPTGKCLKLLTL